MFLLILNALAVFFLWLTLREIFSKAPRDNFSYGYMTVCFCIALMCCWPIFSHWSFERKLTHVTQELANFKPANVECQSATSSIFDTTNSWIAGYAYIDTGEVVFKSGWCKRLKNYLKDPAAADYKERYSIQLLAHEAMHVRGERNEQHTECQAIQRNYRTARMMGVPEKHAVQHSVNYYLYEYPKHPYYDPECKPGSEMDESLNDSTWNFL
ncbi:MAG: hypothetical protein ACI8VW_002263 [bacterium]